MSVTAGNGKMINAGINATTIIEIRDSDCKGCAYVCARMTVLRKDVEA